LDQQQAVHTYLIPDVDAKSWLVTCPEAHQQLLDVADERTNGLMRKVIKLCKLWLTNRRYASDDVPVSIKSFEMESELVKAEFSNRLVEIAAAGSLVLQRAIESAFELLRNRATSLPQEERNSFLWLNERALIRAYSLSVDAVHAEAGGDYTAAYQLWRQLFS
jgi:hypothetical protein